MPTFIWKGALTFPVKEVFEWHTRPGAFDRLSPPWRNVRVVRSSGSIAQGAEVLLKLSVVGSLGPLWLLRHGEYKPPELFTDEQVSGPFKAWSHRHTFISNSETISSLVDEVRYELPLIARPCGPLVRAELERLFRFRHAVLASDLFLHSRWRERPRKRILIAGASGFIGSALASFLSTAGHTVTRLVRRPPQSQDERMWNPAAGELSPGALDGVDVVIHLGGESIASGRWTTQKKAHMVSSRVESTKLLSSVISSLRVKPSLFIVASGVGVYGDTGHSAPDESASAGSGFLGDLAVRWEEAAHGASSHGVRVVSLRIGTVLNAKGGALKKMLPAFRAGIGGPLGSGAQRMSWISLQDLLGLVEHTIFTDSLVGPVNAVAPQVVTNREFARALGAAVHRPACLPMPAALVRLLFGELADAALLANSAAYPRKALESGYAFLFPEIGPALNFECP